MEKAFDKYAQPPEQSVNDLKRRLIKLADWINDPAAAPIEARRRQVKTALDLIQEIDKRLGDTNIYKFTITITPADGSFPAGE
ncbi:MAG: hypothetical protein SWH61_03400 [Thermodesulfobacteriota bacterium]|nr:hypothetical protein [Thermodesulfobacteriota bacterium]